MTVIRHNSISGIVSITAAAGSNLSFYDSTGATLSLDTGDINAGVITATTANFTNATVTGDLTVQGTTTTLDTTVTEVDKLEVLANNTTFGVAITQSGTGDILRLYDGATEVFSVFDGGNIGVTGGKILIDNNGEFALFEDDTSGAFTPSSKISMDFSGNVARIRSSVNGAATIRDLALYTGNSDRLHIKSDGNIGIGTDNPSNPLHISTSSITPLLVESTGSDSYIRFQNSGGSSGYVGYLNAQEMVFWVNGSERLRITSSGNVGIGITNPVNNYASGATQTPIKLAVVDNTSSSGFTEIAHFASGNDSDYTGSILRIGHHGNDRGMYIKGGRGSSDRAIAYFGLRGSNEVSTDMLTLYQLDANHHRVGIMTDNPQAALAIGGPENDVIEIEPNIASGRSRILSYNRVSSAYRGLRLDGSELRLETSSVPKLRIAANGNVGIGDDFDANNFARLTVYEDNYTYGRSLAPTSTGQYAASYSPPVGTFLYRNNTDSGTMGVRQYVQAENGYPNAQGYLDVLIKNSGFYTIRIKASTGSASAAVATMLVYGLANSTNSNHPVVSITGAEGSGTSNATFASGHGKGSANAVATFWWEVLNYNVNTYDCTMRIHTTHSNNQGLRAIIEECI